jgi:hypothetical protein
LRNNKLNRETVGTLPVSKGPPDQQLAPFLGDIRILGDKGDIGCAKRDQENEMRQES